MLKEYTKEDNTSYFSASERKKINDTTIYTNDTNNKDGVNNNVNYATTDKLYAAYGDYNDDQYVTVGTNAASDLNCGVRIDISKWGDESFWLRSPYGDDGDFALVALPGDYVSYHSVGLDVSVVPALNLNLSSVLFASAAKVAVSTNGGYTANDAAGITANTYNLRYASKDSESAVINQSETEVKVTNTAGKYLMVQNGAGVYAKAISGDTEQTIPASDIQMGSTDTDKLTDFSNCKVWLESTDADRITTAKMAVREINSVTVTDIAAQW